MSNWINSAAIPSMPKTLNNINKPLPDNTMNGNKSVNSYTNNNNNNNKVYNNNQSQSVLPSGFIEDQKSINLKYSTVKTSTISENIRYIPNTKVDESVKEIENESVNDNIKEIESDKEIKSHPKSNSNNDKNLIWTSTQIPNANNLENYSSYNLINPFDSINQANTEDNQPQLIPTKASDNSWMNSLLYSKPNNNNTYNINHSHGSHGSWYHPKIPSARWNTNMWKSYLYRNKYEMDKNNIIYEERCLQSNVYDYVKLNNNTIRKIILSQSVNLNNNNNNKIINTSDINICMDNHDNTNLPLQNERFNHMSSNEIKPKQSDELREVDEFKEEYYDMITNKIKELVINPYDFQQLNNKNHWYIKQSTSTSISISQPSSLHETPKYQISKNKIKCINNNPFIWMPNKNTLPNANYLSIPFPKIDEMDKKWEDEFYSTVLKVSEFHEITRIIHTHENNQLIQIIHNHPNDTYYTRKINIFTDNLSSSLLKGISFALVEKFILSNNLQCLTKVFYYMAINVSDDAKKEVIIIIKNIWIHWDNNQWNDAYIAFVNASTTSDVFFVLLIKALKKWILFFIELNKHLLKDYELTDYNFNSDSEDYITLLIIPYIFDVNISVITDEEKEFLFSCYHATDTTEANIIYLKYHNYSYSIYYKISNLSYYQNYYNFSDISSGDINLFGYTVVNASENTHCNKCNNISDTVIFREINNNEICKQCLTGNIRFTLKEMFKSYVNNNYTYLEEYVNLFKIHDNPVLLLSDNWLNAIMSITSVAYYFQEEVLNERCSLCKGTFYKENKEKNMVESKAFSLKCGCIYCIKCVKKMISEQTNNKILLNEYEANKMKVEFKCEKCNCIDNTWFDCVRNLYDICQLRKDAEIRLKNIMQKICCICEMESENNIKYNVIKKQIENKHCICVTCKKNLDLQNKEDSKKAFWTDYCCLFCKEKHIYIHWQIDENEGNSNYMKRRSDKTENKCCFIV